MSAGSLASFIGRRLIASLLVLIGISMVVFLFVQLAPGSPEQTIAGRGASPEQLAAVRAAYGLDDPLPEQYLHFAERAVQLDFGTSFSTRQPVTEAISDGLNVTVPLLFVSFFFIVLIGVTLGMISAHHIGDPLDRSLMGASVVAASVPPFVTAIFLMLIFGVELGWLPIFGEGKGFVDSAEHLVLPIVTLTLAGLAAMLQITRTRVKEVRREDYVSFAEARGLPRLYILRHTVLRNAGIQIVTQCGTVLIGLIVGAVLVEETFGLHGVGSLLVSAISTRDIPLVQGITLLIAAFVLILNLVIDLLYFVLDPRVQAAEARARAAS